MSTAIVIDGRIELGDTDRFAEIAEDYRGRWEEAYECPDAVVILNSPGGELREAISLGRKIAELGFGTIVGSEGVCASACVFALAGGAYLGGSPSNIAVYSGARIGLHQPQFSPSERDLWLLSRIPEEIRLTQAFLLSGNAWNDVTRYLIGERRNVYLMRRILSSPQSQEDFDWLDTFEEFFFAGITVIDSRAAALSAQAGERRKLADSGWMTADRARRFCAISAIASGELVDFGVSYGTEVGQSWIVGFEELDRFCIATSEGGIIRTCHFDNSLFWELEATGELPVWMQQWGIGAMGFYPAAMFDFNLGAANSPMQSELGQMSEFFAEKLENQQLCDSLFQSYNVDAATAFDKVMVFSPDCQTPEGLCERD